MGLCVSTETDDYEHVKYFDGQRCLGFRHGEGTYYYENGDIYVGEWRWNMKHGRGVYSPKNEEVSKALSFSLTGEKGSFITMNISEQNMEDYLLQQDALALKFVQRPNHSLVTKRKEKSKWRGSGKWKEKG
ncbi:uncharacterized protein [Acropora muricata]|uniref:uncharacterized protein isoform X2 n=1 Tax=Acropora muricata TaxID=159855 RepID=UPI0034E5A620